MWYAELTDIASLQRFALYILYENDTRSRYRLLTSVDVCDVDTPQEDGESVQEVAFKAAC